MAAITGFSKDEVMGQDLVEQYITEEFRKSVKEVLKNALLGVQTDNYQLPLFTKDNKRVELLLNAATRCDASGVIVGVVGVGQDITAINQGQAELSRVANDLTQLIETANAPIFGIDTNGYLNEWNRKAAHITGFGNSVQVMIPNDQVFLAGINHFVFHVKFCRLVSNRFPSEV